MPLAALDLHDIAGHQLLGWQPPQATVAPHRDIGRDQRLQRPRPRLGPPLLIGADRGVEQQHGADERCVARVP